MVKRIYYKFLLKTFAPGEIFIKTPKYVKISAEKIFDLLITLRKEDTLLRKGPYNIMLKGLPGYVSAELAQAAEYTNDQHSIGLIARIDAWTLYCFLRSKEYRFYNSELAMAHKQSVEKTRTEFKMLFAEE